MLITLPSLSSSALAEACLRWTREASSDQRAQSRLEEGEKDLREHTTNIQPSIWKVTDSAGVLGKSPCTLLPPECMQLVLNK